MLYMLPGNTMHDRSVQRVFGVENMEDTTSKLIWGFPASGKATWKPMRMPTFLPERSATTGARNAVIFA